MVTQIGNVEIEKMIDLFDIHFDTMKFHSIMNKIINYLSTRVIQKQSEEGIRALKTLSYIFSNASARVGWMWGDKAVCNLESIYFLSEPLARTAEAEMGYARFINP